MKAFESLIEALGRYTPSRGFFSGREPRWFGVPITEVLKVKRCDPSRHNTLRYDQVQRRRKRARKCGKRIVYDKLRATNAS